jgi:hypothetical protein
MNSPPAGDALTDGNMRSSNFSSHGQYRFVRMLGRRRQVMKLRMVLNLR